MVEKFSPYASEAEDESDESAIDKTNAELEKAQEEIAEAERMSKFFLGREEFFDEMLGQAENNSSEAEESTAENGSEDSSEDSEDGEKPKLYDPFSGVEIKPADEDQEAAQAEEQRRAQEAAEADDDDEEEDEDEKDDETESTSEEQTLEDTEGEDTEQEPDDAEIDTADGEPTPEGAQTVDSSETDDEDTENSVGEEPTEEQTAETDEEVTEEEPVPDEPEEQEPVAEDSEEAEPADTEALEDTAEQDNPEPEEDQPEAESDQEQPEAESDEPEADSEQTETDTAEEQEAVEAAYQHAEIEEMMEDEGPEDPDPPDNNHNTRNLAGEPDPNDPNSQFDTLAARRAAQENMHHRSDGLTALLGLGLLGERYFRRKGDKKLGREIDKLQKQTENTQEGQADKISGVELQQQMQAMGLEELRKAQETNEKLDDEQTNEIDNLEAKVQKIEPNQNEQTAEELEAEEEKKKKRLFQSISGETFEETNDESTTEGRERRAGLRLETATEEAPEIIAARNIENQTQKIEQNNLVNSELGFEQKVESQNQVNIQDNTQRDPRELASISEILAERDLFKSRTKDDDVRLPPVNAPQVSTNIEDEKYRSSIEAGIVVGLVIIALAAIFFLFR